MVQESPERCDPGSVTASAVHIKFMQQCQSVTAFESFRSIRQAGHLDRCGRIRAQTIRQAEHLNTCSQHDRTRAQEQRQEWA